MTDSTLQTPPAPQTPHASPLPQTPRTQRISKLARFFGAVPKAFWYVFLGYIVLCIALDVLVAPFVDYQSQWALSPFSFAFLIGGVALGLIGCLLARQARLPETMPAFLKAHGFGLFVAIGTVALFVIQVIFVQSTFYRDNDIDWLIMQKLDDTLTISSYYSIYPNNQFLGGIFAIISQLCQMLGTDDLLRATITIDCIGISGSVCLGAFIARKLGGTKCGVCAFLVLFVFVGLSCNLFVPYSDSYSILFTTLTLFFYVCVPNPAKWPAMTFVAYLGYSLKPTALAVFAAAAAVSLCLWIRDRLTARRNSASAEVPATGLTADANAVHTSDPHPSKTPKALTFAISAVGCVLAVGLAMGVTSGVKAQLNVAIHENERVVPAHFLMMGFNANYDGMFNADDIHQSFSYHDPAEMTAADLSVWQSRVRRLGPVGVAELLVRKNLINYNDGAFFYWSESPLAFGSLPEGTNPIQRFYTITDSSAPEDPDPIPVPPPSAYVAQTLWFMVLAGIALCFLRKRVTKAEMAMALTLLLLSGFLLLFECNARYLFLYSPFYVILGVRGWQALAHRIFARKAATAPANPSEEQPS